MTVVHYSFNKHLLSAHHEPGPMTGTGAPQMNKTRSLSFGMPQSGREGSPGTSSDTFVWWVSDRGGGRLPDCKHTAHPMEVVAPAQARGDTMALPHMPLACSGAQHHPDSGRQMSVSHSQNLSRTFLPWNLWES